MQSQCGVTRASFFRVWFLLKSIDYDIPKVICYLLDSQSVLYQGVLCKSTAVGVLLFLRMCL